MSAFSFRLTCLVLPGIVLFSGCRMPGAFVSSDELVMAQHQSQELYAQVQELQSAHAGAQQMIAGLQTEQQRLNQELADSQDSLATANERVDNLLAERSELKDRYQESLETPYDTPLLTDFSLQMDGFEFDAVTGLYRFIEDIPFDLGSAELRPEMQPILNRFAEAVTSTSAAGHRILIVGHTDDQRIRRGTTAQKHPTNWHLSTDRADTVIVELKSRGVEEERMAAMGYSKFQPLEASVAESARARNRRVELYLIPAGGQMAHWDPVRSIQ